MAKIYDTVDQGDALPALSSDSISRELIARFAGAINEYSPLQFDDDLAKAAGYGGAFAQFHLPYGLATQMLKKMAREWPDFKHECAIY